MTPDTESRTVVLIRHAKSSWDDPSLSDFDRPLNDRGHEDAPVMGKQLALQALHFDRIICSPSQRTTQTIGYIAGKIGFPDDRIEWDSTLYHSSVNTMLRILSELPDSVHTIALVGHNPSMTDLANYLQMDTVIENMPTCGIVSIDFRLKNWEQIGRYSGTLNTYIYPKQIKP